MNSELESYVVDVQDFPKPGIVFKDITPLLESPDGMQLCLEGMTKSIDFEFESIVAIESRGFILGAALANKLNKGLVLVRKPGKLPREVEAIKYDLEYGQDELQIHKSSIRKGQRVIILDDVLATGGTAAATEQLCKRLGAEVLGHRFLMQLNFLKGWEKLDMPHVSLMHVGD